MDHSDDCASVISDLYIVTCFRRVELSGSARF